MTTARSAPIQTMPPNNRIDINVSGKHFATRLNNLKKYPNTLLGSELLHMFYDRGRGEYFFDRDPDLFHLILNYYRLGTIHVSEIDCPGAFQDELEFFGIPHSAIDECCVNAFTRVYKAEKGCNCQQSKETMASGTKGDINDYSKAKVMNGNHHGLVKRGGEFENQKLVERKYKTCEQKHQPVGKGPGKDVYKNIMKQSTRNREVNLGSKEHDLENVYFGEKQMLRNEGSNVLEREGRIHETVANTTEQKELNGKATHERGRIFHGVTTINHSNKDNGKIIRVENEKEIRRENGQSTCDEIGKSACEKSGESTCVVNRKFTSTKSGEITREKSGQNSRHQNGKHSRDKNGKIIHDQNGRSRVYGNENCNSVVNTKPKKESIIVSAHFKKTKSAKYSVTREQSGRSRSKNWKLSKCYDNRTIQVMFQHLYGLLILSSAVSNTIETIDCHAGIKCGVLHQTTFFAMETFFVVVFTADYVIRFILSRNKLTFVRQVLNIVDLLAILPYYLELFVSFLVGASDMLITLRVLRVLRLMKLSRSSPRLQTLVLTLRNSLNDLLFLYFIFLMGIVLFGSAIYYVERDGSNSGNFSSIPDSLWFTCVTMVTTG